MAPIMTLSVREILPNTRQVVADHLDKDEYPIRVRLTRPLTDHERRLAEAHPGWTVADGREEIVLTGRLETFDEAQVDLLIRDVRRLQDEGRALDEQDEQRQQREHLEHLAQLDRVNQLNRIIDRVRYR